MKTYLLLALLLIPGALALDYSIAIAHDASTADEQLAETLLTTLEEAGHEGGELIEWNEANPQDDNAVLALYNKNIVSVVGRRASSELVIMVIDAQTALAQEGGELKNIFSDEVNGRDIHELHEDIYGAPAPVDERIDSCTDTDGGQYDAIAGTATGDNAQYRDTCTGESTLREAYCSGDEARTRTIDCRYGCAQGACRLEPPCTDDGSIVTKGPHVYQDTCDGDTLIAYACDGDTVQTQERLCENGCQDGACLKAPTPAAEDSVEALGALGQPCQDDSDCESGLCADVCVIEEEQRGFLEWLVGVLARLFG